MRSEPMTMPGSSCLIPERVGQATVLDAGSGKRHRRFPVSLNSREYPKNIVMETYCPAHKASYYTTYDLYMS